jgi:hypothetical protein
VIGILKANKLQALLDTVERHFEVISRGECPVLVSGPPDRFGEEYELMDESDRGAAFPTSSSQVSESHGLDQGYLHWPASSLPTLVQCKESQVPQVIRVWCLGIVLLELICLGQRIL